MPISIANSAADWLFASFWKDFPDLKIALSEGSIGWVPYFLERAETTVRQHSAWTNLNLGGLTPTEIFRRHFLTCFIEDNFGLENRPAIGFDNIAWDWDYPHSACNRRSAGQGKRVAVREDLGGGGVIKKKKNT